MKRNTIQSIVLVVFLVTGITLAVVNIWFWNDIPDFFKTNAILMLNFFVVITISFWLVQRNTDQRKRRDVIDDILNRCCKACEEYSLSVDALSNSSDDSSHRQSWRKMLTTKQKLENYLALLDEYNMGENYKDKLKSVRDSFRQESLLVEDGLSQYSTSETAFDYTRFLQSNGIVESGLTTLRIILYK